MVDKNKNYNPLNEGYTGSKNKGYTGGENNSQPPKKIDNVVSAIIPATKPSESNTQNNQSGNS